MSCMKKKHTAVLSRKIATVSSYSFQESGQELAVVWYMNCVRLLMSVTLSVLEKGMGVALL